MKVRQRLLEINPVLWWTGDMPGLHWLAWVIVLAWGIVLSVAVVVSPRDVVWVYYGAMACGFLLKMLAASQACRFFAETRQNGSLEMLLCTPLQNRDIVRGQWLSLKRLFLWPLIILALLNLANTPETFAKVIRTSIVVGDLLIRNPHIHYGDWPDFNGVTAVDRAVQIVATGSTGGP